MLHSEILFYCLNAWGLLANNNLAFHTRETIRHLIKFVRS